jgi:hypothetical protein
MYPLLTRLTIRSYVTAERRKETTEMITTTAILEKTAMMTHTGGTKKIAAMEGGGSFEGRTDREAANK